MCEVVHHAAGEGRREATITRLFISASSRTRASINGVPGLFGPHADLGALTATS